jgi:aminoglycoside phosphotransferase (APT) family kinase protein
VSEAAGAGPVRDEDAFDVPAAAAWLRTHAADASGLDGIPQVQQFSGGASNLTYLLRYAASPGASSGRDLVLRRPPAGTKARGAHDMGREHGILTSLAPVFPQVPRTVAHCADESVIGSEFYVMDRIVGTILRRDVPPELGLQARDVRRLCTAALDTLVELHRVDVDSAGLAALGRGPGYVARQVGGWSQRYRRARTDDVGDFEEVMAWLDAHQMEDVGEVLIHNDFRFDNLVLAPEDPTRVIGVLDWEMATVGDPLMDLGGAMAYWVQADDDEPFRRYRLQPTHEPGMLTRAEAVAYYTDRMGLPLDPGGWTFYEVFGLFRLAAIGQQIYYRYHRGQTTNPAYGRFFDVVVYLEDRCRRLIAAAPPPPHTDQRTATAPPAQEGTT